MSPGIVPRDPQCSRAQYRHGDSNPGINPRDSHDVSSLSHVTDAAREVRIIAEQRGGGGWSVYDGEEWFAHSTSIAGALRYASDLLHGPGVGPSGLVAMVPAPCGLCGGYGAFNPGTQEPAPSRMPPDELPSPLPGELESVL